MFRGEKSTQMFVGEGDFIAIVLVLRIRVHEALIYRKASLVVCSCLFKIPLCSEAARFAFQRFRERILHLKILRIRTCEWLQDAQSLLEVVLLFGLFAGFTDEVT